MRIDEELMEIWPNEVCDREGGSGGIRKKLKSEYAAYLESRYRRNDGNSI